jgi:parvulin-like peptidyl-prolyl isomerase
MTVKLKNMGYIKCTLIALTSVVLLNAEVVAAGDPASPDSVAKAAAASGPISKDTGAKDAPSTASNTDKTGEAKKGLPYFAKVGNMYVTWIDYNYEYSSEAIKKFYHAKPSEDKVAVFQREIADTLITNAMLVQEAKRRKLKPDNAYVKQNLEKFDQRFGNDPKWKEARPRVLPIITARFEHESLRNKLEKSVRNVRPPSVKTLKRYYADHLDKFTAPSSPRVAVILIRVDPGAPTSDWEKANEQAGDLVKRLRAGEDFAKLAREYSGDKTAEDGGDMGYLHEGMLPGLPADTVSKLQPGETSDPVDLMEGVGIFRLIDRKPSEVRSFKVVQSRAKELWMKEQSDIAWNSLIAKLKKSTPVQVDESHFLPLPDTTKQADQSEEASKTMEKDKP